MKNSRHSKFELLRIVSMFLIILYHFIYHGNLIENCQNKITYFILIFIEYLTIIHVNSFILVSGYFQSTCKIKQSKIWQLINSSLFYRITIASIFSICGMIVLTKVNIIHILFPLNLNEYLFIKFYIFLYCLTPFINKLIDNMTKKEFKKLIITLFIIFSILPYITGGKAFDNSGYTLYNFVFLYFLGAYLRKYPLNNFNKLKTSCIKKRIVLLNLFIICALLNTVIIIVSKKLVLRGPVFNEIFGNFVTMSLMYSNPIIIVQTIIYFLFFDTLKISSNFINKISKLTLGVYLIHDNSLIRKFLYGFFKVKNRQFYSIRMIIYIIIISLVVYIICLTIEYLRQKLFLFIYNRKISINIRKKYYKFLEKYN